MKRQQFLTLLGGGMAGLTLGQSPFSTDWTNPELDDHQIDEVKFTHVELRWPRFVGRNAWADVLGYLPGNGRGRSIIILYTDQGARGWGIDMLGNFNRRELTDKLKGKKVSKVIDPASGILTSEFEGFEFPLFDLTGKILNKPVYQLLGRKEPITCPCYSGMIYFDDLDAPNKAAGFDRILEECQQDYDFGYRQFKLKIGRGYKWMDKEKGIKRDIEITKLVNEHFPNCDILVDANDSYALEELYRYFNGIEEVELFWIEEPFKEETERYRKLNNWLKEHDRDLFLADGEFRPNHNQMMQLGRGNLLDVFVQDIAGYGFTNWIKLMPELKSMGILASPHSWALALKSYYTSHLAGALGNTVTIEGVTCESDDVDLTDYKLEDGKLIPSSKPGFGIDLIKNI